MHFPTTAGGGGLAAAQGSGGGEAGAAEKEGGVPERPGEAKRRPEEAGEGQRGCAAAARQDGGAPSGWGEPGHFTKHNNNDNMISCSLQENCLSVSPRLQGNTQWAGISCFAQLHSSRVGVYGCLYWRLQPGSSWKWIKKCSWQRINQQTVLHCNQNSSYIYRILCQNL